MYRSPCGAIVVPCLYNLMENTAFQLKQNILMRVFWITETAVSSAGYFIKQAIDKNAFIPWSCTYMPELNMSLYVCVMRAYVNNFPSAVLDLCFFL